MGSLLAAPAFAAPSPTPVPQVAVQAVRAGAPATVSGYIKAAGQWQWIDCRSPVTAAGRRAAAVRPTAVLISGLGASHSYWAGVRASLLSGQRVCWYDRPGLGKSPPRQGNTTVNGDIQGRELAALLWAAGERRPVVLVAHSYGGLMGRAFNVRFPSRVAGMVLVDTSYATQWMPDDRYWGEGNTTIDMAPTGEFVAGRTTLGAKPLAVVTAGIGSSANWHAKQDIMRTFSSNSFRITVWNSEHVIMANNPAVVARAIKYVTNSAATHQRMPSCASIAGTVWGPLGAYCGGHA